MHSSVPTGHWAPIRATLPQRMQEYNPAAGIFGSLPASVVISRPNGVWRYTGSRHTAPVIVTLFSGAPFQGVMLRA